MNLHLAAPKPLKVQTYEILKEAIIRGILTDNEMMTEKRAAEQFQVSRTPFREAIQILESEGWVYTIPYKGTYISPITARDMEEVFELRVMLETSIVEKILLNVSEDSLKRLEQLISIMKTNPAEQDDYEFMAIDHDFHKVIYELTNNKRIIGVFEQTSDTIRRIGVRVLHRKNRREEVISEHMEIVKGLRDGTAGKALLEHLMKTKSSFSDL
ncbi:GntR family transcriptional regulator [Aneurinibacillus tyrosinisolvens]|uniref:GntR family transcriptional regulator n=1 Tax=Aneurinibacillus tyrosinisolvens TaxID=1443435 RepID=UPI00063EDC65|nr:GntR family transcriptional regulator [Aneurinibacillus tyrosinisolvens]